MPCYMRGMTGFSCNSFWDIFEKWFGPCLGKRSPKRNEKRKSSSDFKSLKWALSLYSQDIWFDKTSEILPHRVNVKIHGNLSGPGPVFGPLGPFGPKTWVQNSDFLSVGRFGAEFWWEEDLCLTEVDSDWFCIWFGLPALCIFAYHFSSYSTAVVLSVIHRILLKNSCHQRHLNH